ncbi:myopalladin-like, partial [Anneissia japonica]|uniref:myopalladin-like n=1 Tax=Anneissia japonica TaxID=1529436 RepID=UPI001425589F
IHYFVKFIYTSGDPEPTVTWFRDNIDVSKCPDYDITIKDGVCCLKIEEAFPEDAGKFKVVAENAIGKASSTANLLVEELKEAPEFKKRLDNYEVNEGDRVEMETIIRGYPRPMVRWYHNGEEIKSSIDINITQTGNTNKLTIPEVFEEDAGEYICKAENAAGVAQSIAELTVKRVVIEKPTVAVDSKQDEGAATDRSVIQKPTPGKVDRVQPPKPKVSPPVSSNLALSATSQTAPASDVSASSKLKPQGSPNLPPPKWTPPVPPSVKSPKKTPPAPTNVSPPKVTPSAPHNVASPKKIPSAPSAKNMPPTFTKLLHDVTCDEGSQAELTCHVTGRPEPEVKWRREGERIEPSLDFEIFYKDGDATLTIPEVFVDDAGRFTCSASNTEGERSTSCILTVKAADIPEMKGMKIKPTYDAIRHPDHHNLLAPCFTKPLQPVKLVEGMRARFECQVEGYPVPEIVWLMKGLPIAHGYRFIMKHNEQSGQCSLEITMALRDDIGEFTCIAKNQAGQTTTTSPLLPEVAYNRWFKEQELERERKEREEQRLAHALEMEKQKYMATQPQTDHTFVASEPEVPVNPFQKRLMSEVAFRERSSSQDRIIVHDKDQGVKLSPFERRLMTEVSYRERVTGDHDLERAHIAVDKEYMVSPFEVRLAKEISFRDHSLGVDTADHPAAAPVAFDIEAFEAELLNGSKFGIKDGNITETDTETEFTESELETDTDRISAPRFVKEMKNIQLMEGSPVTLSCRVSGRPRPMIQWFKDGYIVRKSQRLELRQTEGFCSLRINMALPSDSGHYTVLATNTAGKAVCSSRLLVKGSKGDDSPQHMKGIMGARVKMESQEYNMPDRAFIEGEVKEKYYRPAFKEIPQDLIVVEGKVARFNCKVTGRPPPDFEWLLNGQPVRLDRNHQVIINEGGINSLVIYYTAPADAGVYTCTAKNRAGQNQFSVNLNVEAKARMVAPSFIDRIQNVAVKVNEPVTMQCKVTGTPVPTVSWQKDGHFIHPTDTHYITEVKDGVCTLHIDAVQRWDSAWYSCTVLNSAGRTSCRAKLIVHVDKRPSSEPRQLIIPKRSPALP